MENQPTKLDKAVKISVVVGALIIALSIAYYLVIFLPNKEETRIERQKQDQLAEKNEKEVEELKKKQEKCLANVKDIRDKLDKDDKESARIGLMSIQRFDDIFYSQSLDDCLYVVFVSFYLKSETIQKMNIKSATTGSLYHSFEWPTQQDEFYKLISNYKK